MAKITGLPDLEDLQHEPDNAMWSLCEHCETEPADFHVLCPARVLDYANRLVAEERARAVAVLEGVLRQVRSKEAAATADYDRTAFQYERDEHASGKACAYSEADDLLTKALTTLTGSDR